jgi:hypothetical protein
MLSLCWPVLSLNNKIFYTNEWWSLETMLVVMLLKGHLKMTF